MSEWTTAFRKYESLPDTFSISWKHEIPVGSMADRALQNGRIIEISSVPSILTMEIAPPTVAPQQNSGGFTFDELMNLDQAKMLEIMGKVETVLNLAAECFETAVKAHVVFSQWDQNQYLCVHFEDSPSFIFGGRSRINHDFQQNPEPLRIFEAYRVHFICSLRKVLPPPLYNRLCKIVDHDLNMQWVLFLLTSADFREIVKIMKNVLRREEFLIANTILPEDFSFKKPEMVTLRNSIQKKMEEESRKFWSYERVGAFLKV